MDYRMKWWDSFDRQVFKIEPSPTQTISMAQMIEEARKGKIRREDVEIMAFLFEHVCADLDQMSVLFARSGDALRRSLDRLVAARMLNKFCVAPLSELRYSDERPIYCIDAGGAEFLSHYIPGEDFDNFKIDKIIMPPEKAQRYIVSNELFVKLVREMPGYSVNWATRPTLRYAGKKIKPNFAFGLTDGDGNETHYCGNAVTAESIAPFSPRTMRFGEKADQFDILVGTDAYKDAFGESEPPTLVFICEDDKTMARAAAIVASTTIEEHTASLFTTLPRMAGGMLSEKSFAAIRNGKLAFAKNGLLTRK